METGPEVPDGTGARSAIPGRVRGPGSGSFGKCRLGYRLARASPNFSPCTALTILLFPKARLLRWNQEEEEAKEDGDGGVGAEAFPGKETSRLEEDEREGPGECDVRGQAGAGLLLGPGLQGTSTFLLASFANYLAVNLTGSAYCLEAGPG